jgi:hypothetical protein
MKTTIVHNGVTGTFTPAKGAKLTKAEIRHNAIKATMTNAVNIARASSHNAAVRKVETIEAGQNLLAQFKNMTAAQASEQLRALCPSLDAAHFTFTPANMPSLFTASKGASIDDYQTLSNEFDNVAYATIHESNKNGERFAVKLLDDQDKDNAITFNGSLLDLSVAYDICPVIPAQLYCAKTNNYYKIVPHLRGLMQLQSKHAELITQWAAKREAAVLKKRVTESALETV